MLTYATPDDLAEWTGTPAPGNAALLLRSASLLIRRATRLAFYDTTTEGLPTDTVLVTAMRDATCAQVAQWIALGVDPASGPAGAGGVVQASSIGGASVQYATYASQAEERASSLVTLTSEAAQILADAGLLSGVPIVYG